MRAAPITAILLLVLVALTGACSGELEHRLPADGPAVELGAGDGPSEGGSGTEGTRDMPPVLDTRPVYGQCLPEQICVHFINDDTCQELKSQCIYRTAPCYSSTTNPCCDCEVPVCDNWYTCKSAKGCTFLKDGGSYPSLRCYCFSK